MIKQIRGRADARLPGALFRFVPTDFIRSSALFLSLPLARVCD